MKSLGVLVKEREAEFESQISNLERELHSANEEVFTLVEIRLGRL